MMVCLKDDEWKVKWNEGVSYMKGEHVIYMILRQLLKVLHVQRPCIVERRYLDLTFSECRDSKK